MTTPPPAFNPYLKWLGIRASSPDHYQLLGIERLEDDPDVISAAADRQMAHVRKYQNGPHSDQSQRLLNELAAAKLCLLSPDRKHAYDKQLTPLPTSTSTGKHRGKLAVIAVVGVLIIAAAVLAPQLQRWQSDITHVDPELTTGETSDDPFAMIPVGISPQEENATQQAGEAQEKPNEPDTGVAKQPPPPLVTVIDVEGPVPDPASAVTINLDQPPWELPRQNRRSPKRPFVGQKHAKAQLLQAMYDRKQKEADKAVKLVLSQADGHLARLESFRLEALYWKFTEFWQKVELGLDRSGVNATLEFRGQPVTVAAKTDEAITLRAAGDQTKQFDLKITAMDPDLAIALAKANGQATGPMLDVMIAVFLATDRQGDLIQAKPLLDEAQAAGIPVEVLLASNEEPADDQPGRLRPGRAPADATRQQKKPATPAASDNSGREEARLQNATATRRWSPPDESVRDEKLQMIRDLYREQYAARGDAAQKKLAKDLFNVANRSKDDPDARFTMYEESIRLASENGDVQTTDSAIRAVAYNFDVDEHAVRLPTFKQMRRHVRGDHDRVLFCKTLVDHVDALVATDDYPLALDYASLASSAARSFRQTEMLVEINGVKDRVERLQRRYAALAPQRELLAGQPDENDVETTQAHLEIGSFLAFEKGDFEQGAEHLLMSGDEALAELAQRELDDPRTAAEQVALADSWWQVGESNSEFEAARRRAVHWYQTALPHLEGVTQKRAASRIQSIPSPDRNAQP